jgi:hypothetical protein
MDEVIANKHVQVLIPPDSGTRDTPRPGWTGGRYTWMRYVLASELGDRLYRKRKQMIEPVFGHTKHNRGITRFHRRGRTAVRTEWRLLMATHNLTKLHNHQLASVGAGNGPHEGHTADQDGPVSNPAPTARRSRQPSRTLCDSLAEKQGSRPLPTAPKPPARESVSQVANWRAPSSGGHRPALTSARYSAGVRRFPGPRRSRRAKFILRVGTRRRCSRTTRLVSWQSARDGGRTLRRRQGCRRSRSCLRTRDGLQSGPDRPPLATGSTASRSSAVWPCRTAATSSTGSRTLRSVWRPRDS